MVILGSIPSAYQTNEFALDQTQMHAWKEQIKILQKVLQRENIF